MEESSDENEHYFKKNKKKRKRRREDSSDKKSRKTKRDKLTNDTLTKDTPLTSSSSSSRHRNLSQLAKLVQSGHLSIPSSLSHFVDNNNVLIDQLFTILTPNDIEGLLPDVLKKLKTKHIKELCLRELIKLSQEELHQILSAETSEQTTPTTEGCGSNEVVELVNDERRSLSPDIHVSDISDDEALPTKSHDLLTRSHDLETRSCDLSKTYENTSQDITRHTHISDTTTSHTHITDSKSHDLNDNVTESSGALFRVGTDSEDNIELNVRTSDIVMTSDSEEEEGEIKERKKE